MGLEETGTRHVVPPQSAHEVVFTAWRNQVQQLRKQILQLLSSPAVAAAGMNAVRAHCERSRDTAEKRQAYRDLEIARMDFCESSEVEPFLVEYHHESAERQASMRATQLGQHIFRLLDEFDELRAMLDIHIYTSPVDHVFMLLKMIVLVAYVGASIIVFLPLLPLRLLHPTLRKLGVRNHFLPIDLLQKWFTRAFLFLAGIQVQWEGLEHVDYDTPTIAMFNHASNLDPFLIASGPYAFKWIAKDSLFKVPLFGWVLGGWGHISIDRSNRTAAVNSLRHAVKTMNVYARSVAISAEGKRSTTGRLTDFKKGPFHTAREVGLPITPFVIYGAYQLWPNSRISTLGGIVRVKVLPRLPVEKSDTPASLISRVRRVMLNDSTVPPTPQPYTPDLAPTVLWLPAAYLAVYVVWIALVRPIVASLVGVVV